MDENSENITVAQGLLKDKDTLEFLYKSLQESYARVCDERMLLKQEVAELKERLAKYESE